MNNSILFFLFLFYSICDCNINVFAAEQRSASNHRAQANLQGSYSYKGKEYALKQTESGGNRSTFFLMDDEKAKFVLKNTAQNSDGSLRIDQLKEEVLSDALYTAIGNAEPSFNIHVPAFEVVNEEGRLSRVSAFIEGKGMDNAVTSQQKEQIKAGFVVDAFLANWDVVENLWLGGNGTIYRVDNGGALRYRALGTLKPTTGSYDINSATSDLYTLRGIRSPGNPTLPISTRGAEFYGDLKESQILGQISKLVCLQDIILRTVEDYHARYNINNIAQLKLNLLTRLESLKTYYYDQVPVLTHYQQAHPYEVVVPNKTSASVLITAVHEGKNKVLLGKRVGHVWWGNLGGKADDTDKTLVYAAAREVLEESMGIYSFMSSDLVKEASHDLIKDTNGPDRLHRMYLKRDEYRNPNDFRAALREQTDDHSKEYTDFIWVDAEQLLKLVNDNLETPNRKDEKQYVLLADGKYVYIHHPLMDMLRQAPVVEWLNALAADQHAKSWHDLPVKKVHTAGSMNIPASNDQSLTYPAPAFWDPRAEQLEKLEAIIGKNLDVISEIKRNNKQKEEKNEPITLLPDTTATDAHLQFSLGSDFKPGDDQSNVYYFLRDKSALGNPSNKKNSYYEEFKDSQPSPSAYAHVILESLKKEREMKNWFVFYHALPNKMSFMYDVATEFRNAMRYSNAQLGEVHSLRALDIYFKGLKNVADFIQKELATQKLNDFRVLNDKNRTYKDGGLATNIFLFGSPNTEMESTFDMLHREQTAFTPTYNTFLINILSQFGLSDCNKYIDLYDKYLKEEDSLFQIFINPSIVNDVVYLSKFYGVGFRETYQDHSGFFSPSVFLPMIRENPQKANAQLLHDDDVNVNKLMVTQHDGLDGIQARVFLKPEYMADSSKVKIERYYKKKPNAAYFRELREMVRQDVMTFLQSQNEVQADTLENPSSPESETALPPMQKVYRHMQQGAGKVYEITSPELLYGTFLLKDNLSGIQKILAKNPDFDFGEKISNPDYTSKQENISPIILICNAPEIKKYLTQHYPQKIKELIENEMKLVTSLDEERLCKLESKQIKQLRTVLKLSREVAKPGEIFTEAGACLARISQIVESHIRQGKLEGAWLLGNLIKEDGGEFDSVIEKAIATASKVSAESITRDRVTCSLYLFGLLVEKGYAMGEAISVVKKYAGKTDEEIGHKISAIFKELARKNYDINALFEIAQNKFDLLEIFVEQVRGLDEVTCNKIVQVVAKNFEDKKKWLYRRSRNILIKLYNTKGNRLSELTCKEIEMILNVYAD